MGLDISAYGSVKKIPAHFDADGEPIEPVTGKPLSGEFVQAFVNPAYPAVADAIEDRAVYSYEESDGMRAGSYGGYNQWREWLAELAGYPQSSYEQWGRVWPSHAASCWGGATGPFSEMINFSDCEGVIGPDTSAKLLADFKAFEAKAASGDEFMAQKYKEWMRMFEVAANNGFVAFH